MIKEKKLKPCLKKLIRKYQVFQLHIQMLLYKVKYLNLEIYQSLLIHAILLEWVPFNRFTDVSQIGDEFSKVYSATIIDGKLHYEKQTDGNRKKSDPVPTKVVLKKLNGSQNISDELLFEVF